MFSIESYYTGKIEQIFLYVTNYCNFGCSSCLIGDRKDVMYSYEDLKLILSFIKKIGSKRVTFLGGEPTLHPDIHNVINYANSLNLETVLDTNGTFDTDLFQTRFQKLDTVCYSLDGHNSLIHDKIRQKDSFEKVLLSIDTAKRMNLKVKVTHTIFKQNIEYAIDFLQFAFNNKIDEINFHIGSYNGRAKYSLNSNIVSPISWYETFRKILKYLRINGIPDKTIVRIPPRFCKINEIKYFFDNKCIGKLADRMLILPKNLSKNDNGGNLYVCGLLVGEKNTIGWYENDKFIPNISDNSEFHYYSKLPTINNIPVCPIIFCDNDNLNYCNDNDLVPLCISYKPNLLKLELPC